MRARRQLETEAATRGFGKRVLRYWGVVGLGLLLYVTLRVPPSTLADWPLPDTYGLWYLVLGVTSFFLALGSNQPKKWTAIGLLSVIGLFVWRISIWPVVLLLVSILGVLVWRATRRPRAKIQLP